MSIFSIDWNDRVFECPCGFDDVSFPHVCTTKKQHNIPESLNLRAITRIKLRNSGILHIKDLINLSKIQLLSLPNILMKDFKEITIELESHGITLEDNRPGEI